jgi:NAD(P)-dependent dehydrogenase (short-subunit alcohol dehydrogenase family)
MKSVLITGSNGGIGSAICQLLKSKGYFVIGSDRLDDINDLNGFIKFDIRNLAISDEKIEEFSIKLAGLIGDTSFKALINNAAVQILSGIEELNVEDFRESIDTNLVAPLSLSKLTFSYLKNNKGSIVNIGSIHSKLTKPGFISYATSKSALLGLTQSLSVDCGEFVRVNAIQPAATATEMLLDGFKDNAEKFKQLKSFHPTNSIASPNEIAEAVYFVISDNCQFMNGSVIDINGGIGYRLHDPV